MCIQCRTMFLIRIHQYGIGSLTYFSTLQYILYSTYQENISWTIISNLRMNIFLYLAFDFTYFLEAKGKYLGSRPSQLFSCRNFFCFNILPNQFVINSSRFPIGIARPAKSRPLKWFLGRLKRKLFTVNNHATFGKTRI